MCLSNAEKLRVAIKDKMVYKIIVEDYETNLKTPYQQVPIKVPSLAKSLLEEEKNGFVQVGLHSFKYLRDTKVVAIYLKEYTALRLRSIIKHYHIVRCIIPKGSNYYYGRTKMEVNPSVGFESFASNKLKYLKIIKTY